MSRPDLAKAIGLPTHPVFTLQHGEQTVHCRVSPCSLMYPGYGLQIQYSLKADACNAESVTDVDKTIDVSEVRGERLDEMARASAARWLAANGTAPLAEAIAKWATMRAELQKEADAWEKKEERRVARLIAKRKAEGYTHRFVAVIHPARGDDYMVEAFCKGEPTEKDIVRLLSRSTVKNDYRVEVLS